MIVGAGVTLIALGLVGVGVLTLAGEKSLEALESSDLVKKPIVKKVLDTIGMEVIDLSEEERMGAIEKLDYYVEEFAEEWERGQRKSFEIPLPKLGIDDEAIGVKREIEELRNRLVYLPSVNDIELSEDHYNLTVTVDENVLIACYETRLDEWKTQGQLERYEYHRSRGVI